MNEPRNESPGPADRRGPPDPGQLLTALSTEHFTLQGARSQTMSESSARASVYVFAVSSALVALGFIGQLSDVGDVFNAFALTVLPTLYLLGSVDLRPAGRVRCRGFPLRPRDQPDPALLRGGGGDRADLFLLSGHDDGEGVFANMSLPAEGRKPWFAFSSAILVVNSVVGGTAIALAVGAFLDASLAVAVAVGVAAALVSVVAWLRYADRLLDAATQTEPLFPSP